MSAREREIATMLAHEDRSGVFEAVMSLIKPNISSILDLGCGIGSLSSLLAERYPSALILGMDRSRYLLEQLKNARMRPNVLVVQGEVPVFPLRPGSLDLVVAVQVLHEIFHFKGPRELVSTVRGVYDLLRERGEFIVLDHRNPGDETISVRLSRELLHRLRDFKLRFEPRKICYQILDREWIRMSMRDFYDFVTKIWAMDTSLEVEEMHETHTPFTEQEFADLCQETGFVVKRMAGLTPIDGYLEYYKIIVKGNLLLPTRHFVIDVRK